MSQTSRPVPGQRYRHFKGNLYQILTLAYDSETNEEMVVYQALYGDFIVYVRSLEMFLEPVDREKYPNAGQQYRFERVYPEIVPEPETGISRSDVAGFKSVESETEDVYQQSTVRPAAGGTAERADEAEIAGVDPLLIQFLDADTYTDKLKVFLEMRDTINEVLLTDIAASLDISTGTGSLEEQYASVQYALHTLAKYERNKR